MAATGIDATTPPPEAVPPLTGAAEPDNLRDRLRVMLSRLDNQQKILLMVSLAIIIALIAVSTLWLRQTEYRVLFSNLSERDGGAIIAALEQQNIPYKFSEGGTSIQIPGERVYDVRLRLATQGLPKGGNVGFELMENQKFGTSQFAEQVNYQRALEGELALTIQSIAAIQDSRVHLAIPKPTVFVREELKPSASVLLTIYPGRSLDPLQIAGIQNLVSASVPNLSASSVTVIDQSGVLLSQLKNKLLEAGLDPTQMKYIQEIEASAIKRIEDILLPVFGKGNARVQVAADIDFSQTEQTAETYRPNTTPPDIAMRSQQTSESSTRTPSAQGVPGALSNQPPVPATAPINQPPEAEGQTASASQNPPLNTRKDSTTNYEVDKTVRYTKQSVGTIRRLSAAVVLNHRKDAKGVPKPLPDAEIKQIDSLVREAMGFNKDRGDTVSVVSSPFTAGDAVAPELPIWKNPDTLPILRDMLKYLLIAIIVFYLIVKIVRPLVKTMLKIPEEKKPPETDVSTGKEKSKEDGDAKEEGKNEKEENGEEENNEEENGEEKSAEGENGGEDEPEIIAEEYALPPDSFTSLLTQMRAIAKKEPQTIANIIQEWTNPNANDR